MEYANRLTGRVESAPRLSIRRGLRLALAAAALGLIAPAAHAQAPNPPPPTDAPKDAPSDPPPAAPSDAPATPPATPAPADAPAPAAVTVHGTVTGGDNRAPQPGASVSVSGAGAYVFTDAKGEYTLSLPPGSHVVRVEMPGFFALEQTVVAQPDLQPIDFQLREDKLGEVITIIGSRTPRSRLETSVPVDVIGADTLAEASQTETNQLLNVIAPSYNATHLTIVDGTDHIDPAELRSLGPDHVLVLVNGKRLHQSALVNIYNGGTVGIDLNAIPTSAIARVEILRDGAASQYGSDAIAGVINIVLKEDVNLIDLYTMTGVTASGDGMQFKLGANKGMRLGDRGFLNVTGEFFSRGRTNRSEPWTGTVFPGITDPAETDAELQRRGLSRKDVTMNVGQAGALVGTAFLNTAYKIDDMFELHGQGGYTFRRGKASGFYRRPEQEARVDLRVYPDGFLPEIDPHLHAWTVSGGVRAKSGPFQGDLSITDGGDRFQFFIENSINASLGLASPKNFDAGAVNFHQTIANFDGVARIDQPVFKALSAVGGAEVRREHYSINAGQPESYILGPEKTSDGQPKAPGSQVFPGFQPADDGGIARWSEAVYAGVESQPTARTNLDVGGRFEHYSDFGSTVTGKVAGRVTAYRDSDNEIALRGAASTGFRAPGLQQLRYSTIATQLVGGVLTNILVSPNGSPVTDAFGVPHLKEETSVNFSGGFTARLLSNLSLSADYYRVTIKDRVVLSGPFSASDSNDTFAAAVQNIVGPFPGVGVAQFFVNAVDTTTNGVDVVADYTARLAKGSLKATAAASFTSTTVDNVNVPDSMVQKFPGAEDRVRQLFLGRYGKNRLEDLLPRQKGTIGLRWDGAAGLSVGGRANFFGPTEFHSDDVDEDDPDGNFADESFGAKVTFDLDVGYRFSDLSISIGGTNVFNTFPDEVKRPFNRFNDSFLYTPAGLSAGAPYGTDGAFYYVRAEYRR
jgi:iron complex outermembrane receptor protein